MKFTNEHCPKCKCNDLLVEGSKIYDEMDLGIILFKCNDCGKEFRRYKFVQEER